MAPKQDRLQVRMDEDLKRDVESILDRIGLDHSTTVTLFYRYIQNHGQLPFTPGIPNETTRQAIEEARSGDTEPFDSLEDLLDESD